MLSTRLVRIVLDEWREVTYKERVFRLAFSIIRLRTNYRLFRDLRLEWLCRSFSAYITLKRRAQYRDMMSEAFSHWYQTSVGDLKLTAIIQAIVLVNRVKHSINRWVVRKREEHRLRRKAQGVEAISDSRVMLKAVSAWIDLYRQRPASLRFRLNLPSFMKYVPPRSPEREEVSLSAIYPSRRDKPLASPVVTPEISFSQSSTLRIHHIRRPPSLVGLRRRPSITPPISR